MNETPREEIIFDDEEACLCIQKGIKEDTGRDIAIRDISLILQYEIRYMQSTGGVKLLVPVSLKEVNQLKLGPGPITILERQAEILHERNEKMATTSGEDETIRKNAEVIASLLEVRAEF